MITQISVSILGIDYEDQSVVDQSVMRITNANFVHFDICDGKFVKEKSFNHELVKATKLDGTRLKKDVHLMIKDPEKYVAKYLAAGADMVTFHVEATKSPKKVIEAIHKKNALAGVAISPATPITKIEKLIPEIDYVLVMTVKPGKPGQKLIKTTIKKVRLLRKKHPELTIQVDGGINDKNAGELIDAGANILVAGNFVFKSEDPKLAIDLLRNA
jgi:ribulose-phosphate 3-epimerase